MTRKQMLKAAVTGGTLWSAYRYQPLRVCPGALFGRSQGVWYGPEAEDLFRPGAKVLIVTAHPDDTEFYLGGLLLKLSDAGARLSLLVATDGDKGYYPFAKPDALRQIRREEQRRAAALWQAEDVQFLGHGDGRLRVSSELIGQIREALERFEPEFVLLFEYRFPPLITHQDHLNAGRATYAAIRQAGLPLRAMRFSTVYPNFAVDVTAYQERRCELLACHASQWHDTRYRQVLSLVTDNARQDGKLLNVSQAEGLRCTPEFLSAG